MWTFYVGRACVSCKQQLKCDSAAEQQQVRTVKTASEGLLGRSVAVRAVQEDFVALHGACNAARSAGN